MRHPSTTQTWARIAGVLLIVSVIAGGIGEYYVPNQLVAAADAGRTAHNIVTSAGVFRLGFAAYLIEAICDISLALLFYLLLRDVGRELAALALLFRILATALFAMTELLYFAALLILGGDGYLSSFTPDQLSSLALLAVKTSAAGGGIFSLFYGISWLLFGYLMYRSKYFPRLLGGLLALSGAGFVARSFAVVLAPALASSLFLLPVVIAVPLLAVWLLVRGAEISPAHSSQRGTKAVRAGA